MTDTPQWHQLGETRAWTWADRYAVAETIELGERVTDESEGFSWSLARARASLDELANDRSRDIWAKVLADGWRHDLDVARCDYYWLARVTESDWDMGAVASQTVGSFGPARDEYAALDLVRAFLIERGNDPDSIEDDGTDPPALRISCPSSEMFDDVDDDDASGWDYFYTVEPDWQSVR